MSGPSRVVLVSGASQGIGRACALELDRRGFRVLAGVRRPEDGESLRTASAGRITPVPLDVTSAESRQGAARAAETAAGADGLWGLVNNAGVVYAGPLEYLPIDALRAQFEVNVFGLMALTQACLPLLRMARGRVVNISSASGRIVSPFSGAYAASKFAVEALSDALRMELSPTGVRVIVVQPGAVRTQIWHASRDRAEALVDQYPPQALQHYRGVLARLHEVGVPARACPPELVAAVVVRALQRRRPRTRYQVGLDSRIGTLLARLLPGAALDAILLARRRRRPGGDR